MRSNRSGRRWHLYALGLLVVVMATLGVLEIGPPSSSARTSRQIVTAQRGVVQSTVTATGAVEAGTDDQVNFKTSGVLNSINVSLGQHVSKGQLIATLNPTNAELSLSAARKSLTAARDSLTAAENGTSSSSSGGSGSSTSNGASLTGRASGTEFVSFVTRVPGGKGRRPSGKGHKPSRSGRGGRSGAGSTPKVGGASSGSGRPSSGTSTGASSASASSSTTTTPSPSAIASAKASVYTARENLRTAEQALAETRLYAPASGTIASLSNLVPGDSVSAGATTSGAASSTSSSSGSSSGASSSSSSAFTEIVNRSTLTMTVSFSESDITKVRVGQPATVTFDALSGVELAGKVTQISSVGTSTSGVVSYSATITLNQTDHRVRPGMSASASVVVSQVQGVTLPNQAISGSGSTGTVNLLSGGHTSQKEVAVGLRGDNRTQIVSGLSVGQQVVVTINLPALGSSSSSSSSGGTLGGGGRFGGGGQTFFRGGSVAFPVGGGFGGGG
jgi:membrane fusion protein, macrolide-specific efflux system